MSDNYKLVALLLVWFCYCWLHSFLSDQSPKKIFAKLFQGQLHWYRLVYNLIATFTFSLAFYLQMHWATKVLFENEVMLMLSYGMMMAGMVVVIMAFISYPFLSFAGIDILFNDFLKNRGMFTQNATKDELIIKGISKRIRHPLYLGVFLMSWGYVLYQFNYSNILLASIFTFYIYYGLHREEKKLIKEFGEAYIKYKSETPFLFPLIFSKTKKTNFFRK